jgi:hypothetical protein
MVVLALMVHGCAMAAQIHGGGVATVAAKPTPTGAGVWPEGMVGGSSMFSFGNHVGVGSTLLTRAGPHGGSAGGGLELCAVPDPWDAAFVFACGGSMLLDLGARFDEFSLALTSPYAHITVAFHVGQGGAIFINSWAGYDVAILGKPSRGWAGLTFGYGGAANAYGKR